MKTEYKECEQCGTPLIINSGRSSAGGRDYYHLKRDEFAFMVIGQLATVFGCMFILLTIMFFAAKIGEGLATKMF